MATHNLFNCDQNSCIVITCDNTYTMESKDELLFVDFLFHPITPYRLQLMSHAICPRRLMRF